MAKTVKGRYKKGVVEPLEPVELADDALVEIIVPDEAADDDAAFLSSAGGWSDLDAETFIRETYERRRLGSRPPVQF